MRRGTTPWAALGAIGSPQAMAAAIAAAALLAMVLPLPALIVDMLLALSMGLAVGVLLVALAAPDPARLTAFPPVLVLAGLGRIVLCLCVSRLIMGTGHAGALALTLSRTLSGEDAIAGVGLVVVLAVVQLVMITAGVGRMAEVAARFALDAMPGRQMSLDSAVGRGQLSAIDAREQNRAIEEEAGFYGAMDGAGRLLRGEAVAATAIILVTALVAGARGASQASGIAEAATWYATLAAGHGLVILLPGLLTGAAAAVVVARSASGSGLLEQAGGQMLTGVWPLTAGAIALLALGLVPGVAKVPTLIAAVALGSGAWWRGAHGEAWFRPRAQAGGMRPRDDALNIEVGMGLLDLVEGAGGLAERLGRRRDEMSDQLGFHLPPVTVRDSIDLRATEYAISFRSRTMARGVVRPHRLMAVSPSAGVTPDVGRPGQLADGRQGVWVAEDDATSLAGLHYALLTPVEVILNHFAVAVRAESAELFDLEAATWVLEELSSAHPEVMREARGAGITASLLRQTGGKLLAAGLPLLQPLSIVEALVEAAPETTDPETLAVRCRPSLAGMITDYLAPQGRLHALELAPALQDELADSAHRTEHGTAAALPPERAQAWTETLGQVASEHGWGRPLVVMCEPRALLPLQDLCARTPWQLIAATPLDLTPTVTVEFVARLAPEMLT